MSLMMNGSGGGEMMKIPDMVHEVDEVLRLMRRKPAEKDHHDGCFVCGRDHLAEDCPCFDKIPPGVELDRDYDQVCIGCGRIGEICCSKGAYAVLRRCGGCGWRGHWYWDDKCDKDFVHHPNRVKLSFFKDLLSAEQGRR
uniref:uncharacterized protein LOC105353186 n=1 Tax=Fragaria vesca subsp. vesca TaxID=101020 RepID=UPI0005C93D90|nr:PREDICTED: uncharacterized protein LOC105353186 [Fragaria vesca subsp. vesca]